MVFLLLTIDGSYGEGGGQIVRYAIALSVLTKTPVELVNIRSNRPKPGLQPQHLTAISCMKEVCNAKTEGISIGSSTVTFIPDDIKPGMYEFDVGTAGSIPLIFQACILGTVHTPKQITIKLIGGTDVLWAPSWDYFTNVFLPLITRMGINIDTQLIRRGYYPKGGGEAELTISPTTKIKQVQCNENIKYTHMNGCIHIAQLPSHISRRIKHAAIKQAMRHNMKSSLHISEYPSNSPGVGITLWSQSDSSIIGVSRIGQKGITSEVIAEKAVTELIEEIKANVHIDSYAIDQLLPYMVLAEEPITCRIREVSNHTKTVLWLLKQFFEVHVHMVNKNGSTYLSLKKTNRI